MAFRATYIPTGTDITIAQYTDPVSQTIIDEVYGHCEIHDGVGLLECREHDNDPRLADKRDDTGRVRGAWVYLQKRRSEWVICHSPNGIGREFRSHEIHLMTDQHRWQQDYYDRAAQAAGWRTAQEVVLDTGTRLDLVIEGPGGRYGIEVQHSALSVPKVRARHRKAQRSGISTVWSADRRASGWAFKVPHVETNELPHGHLPRGLWTVTTGPRRLDVVSCSPRNADRLPCCPRPRARNWCGGWHPVFRPKTGIVVDDIAERVPAGDLVPLDTRTKQGIILVTATDRDRWMNEFAPTYSPPPKTGKTSKARPCGYQVDPDMLLTPSAGCAVPDDLPDHAWQLLAAGYDR